VETRSEPHLNICSVNAPLEDWERGDAVHIGSSRQPPIWVSFIGKMLSTCNSLSELGSSRNLTSLCQIPDTASLLSTRIIIVSNTKGRNNHPSSNSVRCSSMPAASCSWTRAPSPSGRSVAAPNRIALPRVSDTRACGHCTTLADARAAGEKIKKSSEQILLPRSSDSLSLSVTVISSNSLTLSQVAPGRTAKNRIEGEDYRVRPVYS
jgi:hypothetical protein